MITKIAKCAAMMLTVVSAQHGISPLEFFEEKEESPQVGTKGNALDWFLFSLGVMLGASLETGTNFGR